MGPAYLVPTAICYSSNAVGCDAPSPNGICGRGIFLSRKLDGVSFYGDANSGSDGFSIEFGSHGQVRSFSLVWPNLERHQSHATASPREIIACLRAHKTMVVPNPGEEGYFQRLKAIAKAKTFTITKITPYFGEGVIGETPPSDVPPQMITPFAELEAVADFGNCKMPVRLISPIVSSEVSRLIGSGP